MTISTIVPMYDVLEYMQSFTALNENEEAALAGILKRTERAVRRYLGFDVLQPSGTYEEYYPEANPLSEHWQEAPYGNSGSIIKLRQFPVRDITSVYEDAGAHAGFGTNAWASTSLLTEGTDYYMDYEFSGYSRTCYLIRLGNSWPTRGRSVKVTYTAGFTAAELNGDVTDLRLDASDIRQAILLAVGEAYNLSIEVKDRSGPLLSERLGDYAQTFANVDVNKRFGPSGLSDTVREILQPFRRIRMV